MADEDPLAPAREREPVTWWPLVVGCGGLLLVAALALFLFAFFVQHKPR